VSFLTEPITLQTLFGQKRLIGPITVQVLKNESSTDRVTMTRHPVQQGAAITDHAFKEPTDFSCNILFKDNIGASLPKLYQELQDLQNGRVPFNITTPKRLYRNMLMTALTCTTDTTSENSLNISAAFSEIIIVPVTAAVVPRSRQKHPGATGATQKTGKKSALVSLKEGLQTLAGQKAP
jgi:hypothetical protein